MAGVERLCNIFEWGREIKRVGNRWSRPFVKLKKKVLNRMKWWKNISLGLQSNRYGNIVQLSIPRMTFEPTPEILLMVKLLTSFHLHLWFWDCLKLNISQQNKRKKHVLYLPEVEFVTAPVLSQAGGVQCRDAGAGGIAPPPFFQKVTTGAVVLFHNSIVSTATSWCI